MTTRVYAGQLEVSCADHEADLASAKLLTTCYAPCKGLSAD